jgi:hypothetical protein
MSLDFQKIPIVFGQGLDTKTDRKMVLPGKLIQLENGVFKNAQSISKRYGYDMLSLSIDGADNISKGAALSVFKDELLLFDGSRVYSRVEATEKWADRGSVISVIEETKSVVANGYEQTNPDMAYNAGLAVYAWEDTRGGVRYSVVDQATSAFVISDKPVTTTGTQPKVLALQNYVYIIFVDGGAIKYCAINMSAPSTLIVENVATSNSNVGTPRYDACVNGARIYLSFNNGAGTGTNVTYFGPNGPFGTETTTAHAAQCIANWADEQQNVWTALYDGYAVYTYAQNFNLSTVLATTTVDSASNQIVTICGIASSPGVQTLFYEFQSFVATSSNAIWATNVTTGGAVGTRVLFARSVGIASKPFLYNGSMYINVGYESPLQSTYFTMDDHARIIAKLSPTVAGGHRSNHTIGNTVSASTGVYLFAGSQKGRILSELNIIFSLLGVISMKLDFVEPSNFLSAELGDNLYVIGGIVQSYDGISFTEHNFHLYPESSAIVLSPNGSVVVDTTPPVVTITGAS